MSFKKLAINVVAVRLARTFNWLLCKASAVEHLGCDPLHEVNRFSFGCI